MQQLSITEPVSIASIGGSLPLAYRLATPNPRESSGLIPTIASRTIDIDLGTARTLDTLFLGYVYAGAYPVVGVTYGTGGYSDANLPGLVAAPSDGSDFRHYFVQLAAPITARFIRLTVNFSVGSTIGCFMAGRSFSPKFGHEWGAGRFITDTGTATRLQDGSFGIDEGVGVGGYQWTFGDLSAEETSALYLIQRRRRTTKSVLVVEDPEQTPGLNERIHWGLFQKLSPYERLDPANTKWALQVGDWL